MIGRDELEKRYQQKGVTIWITGLHGSGKNVLAYNLERRLFDSGATVVLLEGSTVRAGLSRELDYSPADRAEHLRRVAHVCKMLNDQGIIVVASFISPTESIRQQISEIIGNERFHLILMRAGLDYCRTNKPELYLKVEKGELRHLPGVDEAYEMPESPQLTFDVTEKQADVEVLMAYLAGQNIFPLE